MLKIPGKDRLSEDSAPGVTPSDFIQRFSPITSELSLYIHVPFCASICGYCDFNTYAVTETSAMQLWYESVKKELTWAALITRAPIIKTIFFGGGTPSLVGSKIQTAILTHIKSLFPLDKTTEITTEANPESTNMEYFTELKTAGFTRISLGMQSTVESLLNILDRKHSTTKVIAAVQEAASSGFSHINLDLIYGIPTESETDLLDSLQFITSQPYVDHVSAYNLTIEPGTALNRKYQQRKIVPVADEELAARYEIIDDFLTARGFSWYEISNWNKLTSIGSQCRHNINYWLNRNWWGIGPGAHSHINGLRWWNFKLPFKYNQWIKIGQLPIAEWEILDDFQKHMEKVMLAIRLSSGLSIECLTASAQLRIPALVADKLVDLVNNRIILTKTGRLLVDTVVHRLLPL